MKDSIISYPISTGLYLVGVPVSNVPTKITEAPVDTIAVLDVSGSMTPDLPEFKRGLKNMLPSILKPGDSFSLVYFSGPGQCARILDRVRIRDGGEGLLDVSTVHSTIDRLDTIGLTCFTDPLDLVADIAETLKKERPEARRAVLFGSDGYDNTSRGWSSSERRKNILDAIRKVSLSVDRVTTMGIGYCCDQALLQDMAAAAGGTFMFAGDIARYTRDFESAFSKRPDGARRKWVDMPESVVEGLAFSIADDGEIAQYEIVGSAVSVPENVGMVWYLSEKAIGTKSRRSVDEIPPHEPPVVASYAALALFAQRARRKVVRAIAYGLRDAAMVKAALACFGPQRYNALADCAIDAVKNINDRYVDGACDDSPADPNAFTVLDALFALAQGNNRIVPDDPRFSYTPITRGKVNASDVLTPTDATEIAKMATAVAAKASTITVGCDLTMLDDLSAVLGVFSAEVEKIKAQKARKTSYTYDPAPDGYPVDGLVFASEEANVSIRIVRPIHVDVSKARDMCMSDEATRMKMPDVFPSKRYAQHTVITGRVLNMPVITAILDEPTWVLFARHGLVSGHYKRETVALDLSSLPMVNDAMIEGLSAQRAVENAYRLEAAKAALKVAHTMRKAFLPREANEVTAWLRVLGYTEIEIPSIVAWFDALGIRDGGYQPPSTGAAKKDDPRVSWKLDVSIPGLSSLPSVEKVREKMAKIAAYQASPKGKAPKFTTAESLMVPIIESFDRMVADEKVNLDMPTDRDREKIAAWVASIEAAHEPVRKAALYEQGKTAIIAICGGEWFADLKPGEDTVKLRDMDCKVAIRDVEIAL